MIGRLFALFLLAIGMLTSVAFAADDSNAKPLFPAIEKAGPATLEAVRKGLPMCEDLSQKWRGYPQQKYLLLLGNDEIRWKMSVALARDHRAEAQIFAVSVIVIVLSDFSSDGPLRSNQFAYHAVDFDSKGNWCHKGTVISGWLSFNEDVAQSLRRTYEP